MRAWKKWLFFLVVGGLAAWVFWLGIAGYRHNRVDQRVWEVERDFRSVIIPTIEFEETPFDQAMDLIVGELRARTGNKWRWKIANGDFDDRVDPKQPITLLLSNVPAGEALRYTIKLAGGKFENAGNRKIEVIPAGYFDETELVRTYRISEKELMGYLFFQKAGLKRGWNDLTRDFSQSGVDFGDGGSARYHTGSERLEISLLPDEMVFFDGLFSILLEPHRKLSLVEKVSDLIDSARYAIDGIRNPAAVPVARPAPSPFAPPP